MSYKMRRRDYILVTVNKSEYRYEFNTNQPLLLGSDPQIGLKNLFMWHTLPNIAPKYKNHQLRLHHGGVWHDIVIPTGMYEIESLSDFLNDQITRASARTLGSSAPPAQLRFDINMATFKLIVRLSPGVKIDLTKGKLYELLGLEAKVYDKVTEEGVNYINITRGLDKVLIKCSCVERAQENYENVLYDVLPFSEPGSAIMEHIDNVEFHKCRDRILRYFDITVTDLEGNPIQLSEPIHLKIAFEHGGVIEQNK